MVLVSAGVRGGGGGSVGVGVGVVDGPAEPRPSAPPESAGSPTLNGKRSRKFGVISRSSLTRDSRGSRDSRDFEHENGYASTETEATPSEPSTPMDTPTEEGPLNVPPGPPSFPLANHMAIGSTATLPARPRARLSDNYKAESLNSEPSCQVRYTVLMQPSLSEDLRASHAAFQGLEEPGKSTPEAIYS